jgi:hypothetical protein
MKPTSILLTAIFPLFFLAAFLSTLRTQASPASVFIVTNSNDIGAGSLRQAIIDANNSAGPDTIEFSLPANSTIVLGGSQLPTITDKLTIDGSTAVNLTISGNDQSRVFEIGSGTAVTLTYLEIISGTEMSGGGLNIDNSFVALENVYLLHNTVIFDGGGIYNEKEI